MRKIVSFFAGAGALLLSATTAFAQINPPTGAITNTNITPVQIVQFIINFVFALGIAIAVGFLIYGGIKWVLSGGDKAGVEAARNHIVAAVVGLVVVIGAFVIINLVSYVLTGSAFSFSNFCIPSLTNNRCP